MLPPAAGAQRPLQSMADKPVPCQLALQNSKMVSSLLKNHQGIPLRLAVSFWHGIAQRAQHCLLCHRVGAFSGQMMLVALQLALVQLHDR